ncbi:MAG: SDR family oxidoreductase [Gammaproteobacteria bacterium]|nr:SDR family oxidoreductase [Gammaproteobacteria bacterium]
MTQRVALISGAGRGIGRGIALEVAKSGYAVAVGDLNEENSLETVAMIEAAGGKAAFVFLDVSSTDAVTAAVAQTEASLGAIDCVINCAGWDALMPFIKTDEAFWNKVVNINYIGTLRLCHAVLPGMIERGFGRIINIASDAARVGSSMEAVYSGAKGAIISFGKTLARETAKKGVTVNSVCPGPTKTPGMEETMDVGNQKLMESMVRAVPMGRMGEPEDIGAAVAFLASEKAGFITGQTLSVSGGLTMA